MTTMAQKRRGRPAGSKGIAPGQQALYHLVLRLVEAKTLALGLSERDACKAIMARIPGGVLTVTDGETGEKRKIVVGGLDGEGLRNVYRRAKKAREQSPPLSFLAQAHTPVRMSQAEQDRWRTEMEKSRKLRAEVDELRRSGRMSAASLDEILDKYWPVLGR